MSTGARHSDTWRHVHPTSQRGPVPAAQTDADFRDSVRRDALAEGLPGEIADWLSREVGKAYNDDEIASMSPRMQAIRGMRMYADRPVDELADLAAAADCLALLPALRAAALPLSEATALVRDAIDMRTMTVHGARIDNLRAAISARTYWNQR